MQCNILHFTICKINNHSQFYTWKLPSIKAVKSFDKILIAYLGFFCFTRICIAKFRHEWSDFQVIMKVLLSFTVFL